MHGAIHRYLLIRKTCGYKTNQDMIYIMFCTLFATEEDPFGLLHVLLSKAVYHVPYAREQTNTYIIDMVMNLYSFMVLFFSMSKGYSFCLFKGVIVLSQFF